MLINRSPRRSVIWPPLSPFSPARMIFGVVVAAVPEGIKVFSDSLFVGPYFFLNLREVNHPNSDIELPVPVGAFFWPFCRVRPPLEQKRRGFA